METLLSPFTPNNKPPEEKPKPDFFDQYRYYILGVLIIALAVGLYLMLIPPKNTLESENAYIAGGDEAVAGEITGQLVVDIAGGINQPGVYQLDSGSIVEDAISAAGGLSNQADLSEVARSINRAALVSSHSKIYIPKIGDNQIIYTNPIVDPEWNRGATASVNINTASTSKLDTLPGIGPITAQRIIDYRLQNGQFSSIDELKNVPGIGDSKFNSLKDQITT